MFKYYVAHFNIKDCLADIRLNDVPLYIGEIDGYESFSLPLNPYIYYSGEQLLTLSMLPQITVNQPTKSSIWVEITLFDGEGEKLVEIEKVTTSSLVNDGTSILSSIRKKEIPFIASIANPVTRWRDCMTLSESRELRIAVFSLYDKIGNILKDRQYDKYLALISNREYEIVKSIGLDEKEVFLRQKALVDYLSHGYHYVGFEGNEIMHFYAGGKAVALLTADMDPALRFFNEEEGDYLTLDLLLGMKPGKKSLVVV